MTALNTTEEAKAPSDTFEEIMFEHRHPYAVLQRVGKTEHELQNTGFIITAQSQASQK